MPIRPCNEIMGRHLAAWFYPKNNPMPVFNIDQLMNNNTIEKVKANFPDDDMPDWLVNYVETRDRKSAEYETGRDSKMYHADILLMYNRCRYEFRAMDAINEFEISAVDLGMEDWQLESYLNGTFVLDEMRVSALAMASTCRTREDFLYIFAFAYEHMKSVKIGNFHAIPTMWQTSIGLGDWKEGKLEELIGNKAEKKWFGKDAESTSKVVEPEKKAESIRIALKRPVKIIVKQKPESVLAKESEKDPNGEPKEKKTRGRKALSPLGNTKIVGTVIPQKMADFLREKAAEQGVTLNKYVRTVIEEEARNGRG